MSPKHQEQKIVNMLKNLSQDELNIVKDYVVENFNNIITEMAFDRKTVINKVRGLAFPIIEHLIKIARYEDEINLDKHLKDIETWINDIQKLDVGKANKKLKQQDYFKHLCIEPITNRDNYQFITNLEKGPLRNYTQLRKIRVGIDTIELVWDILIEVSKRLSNNDAWFMSDYIKSKLNLQ